MISDVLADAVEEIREYLSADGEAKVWRGQMRKDLEGLLAQMTKMQQRLDTAPAKTCAEGEAARASVATQGREAARQRQAIDVSGALRLAGQRGHGAQAHGREIGR
jgi:hypothetical protein